MDALKTALTHPWLLSFGGLALLVGFLCWRWASQHDLKGLATEAAVKVAWNKGNLGTETELGNRLKALQEEQSNVKRAQTVAGYAARHVLSRFVNWFGLGSMAAGLAMIVAAFFWK